MRGILYFLKRISFAILDDMEEVNYKIEISAWVEFKEIDDEYSTHDFILLSMELGFIEGEEDDFAGIDAFYDFVADMLLSEAENFIAENPGFMCDICLGKEKQNFFLRN